MEWVVIRLREIRPKCITYYDFIESQSNRICEFGSMSFVDQVEKEFQCLQFWKNRIE